MVPLATDGEAALLPLSALQHVTYCERRAFLIHAEGQWSDSAHTVEGQHLHERVDTVGAETRRALHVAFALDLRSLRLGLFGRADAVEFWPAPNDQGIVLPEWTGHFVPYPVEYKRGRRRHERAYEVQVCAQAMCLEEMLGVDVPKGALFYAQSRRRMEIVFDASLRQEVEAAAARLREILASALPPKAEAGPKCDLCSLRERCLPTATDGRQRVAVYLRRALADPLSPKPA